MTFTFSCWIKQQTLFPVVISLQCMLYQLFQLYNIFRGQKNDMSTAGLGTRSVFCELVIWATVTYIIVWLLLKNFFCLLSPSAHQYAKHTTRQNLPFLLEKIPISASLYQHSLVDITVYRFLLAFDWATKDWAIIISLLFFPREHTKGSCAS